MMWKLSSIMFYNECALLQPVRVFHTDVEAQITQKVKKLLTAGFIKPIHHLKWLSNIVPKRKRMVKSVAVWTFTI